MRARVAETLVCALEEATSAVLERLGPDLEATIKTAAEAHRHSQI